MLPIVAVQSDCSGCGIYLLTSSRTCPCCSVRYVTKPKKKGRMTKYKAPSNNWINGIVAFHKSKRKFVSLKDMETEDADHFLICEFNGYDFEILVN